MSETLHVNLMFIGPYIIVIVEEWKTNLMSLAILFHFLWAQHFSDINISIIRSLRRFGLVSSPFDVLVLMKNFCLFGICESNVYWTVHHCNSWRSRKLLMMDILMSEIYWAHKKWNKMASDIKLVLHSSTLYVITTCQNTVNSWDKLY